MKKIFYLAGILVLLSAIMALSLPRKYTVYNDWTNIHLIDTLTSDLLSDTLVVFYSNRGFDPQEQEFLSFDIDDDVPEYFIASFKKGKWWVDRVDNLQSAVCYFPERDYVAYVEGMGKTFPLNLRRASAMTAQYGVNVIMFDYPSIHPGKTMIGNFYFAYEKAKRSAVVYKKFLEELKELRLSSASINRGFTLFHHSMGNLMLREITDQGLESLNGRKIFDNVVLNAACVPQKSHQEWVDKIDFAERIYISYNEKDFQLSGARMLTFNTMLGTRPQRPLAVKAVYIDFHPLVDKGHSNFLNIEGRNAIPEKAHHLYFLWLHGQRADLSQLSLSEDRIGYVFN